MDGKCHVMNGTVEKLERETRTMGQCHSAEKELCSKEICIFWIVQTLSGYVLKNFIIIH